jgi:hypothetical protein
VVPLPGDHPEGSRIPPSITAGLCCTHLVFVRTACWPRFPRTRGQVTKTGNPNSRGTVFGRRGCGTPKALRPILGRERVHGGTPNATPLRLAFRRYRVF